MMKKLFLAALAACGLLLSSCNKESYYHTFGLLYPTGNQVGTLFADQTYDSLYFYTTDDVSIAVYNTPWMSIPDEMRSIDIPSSYRTVYYVSCPVGFEPNTTGRPRSGSITVTANGPDDWSVSAAATYYQLGWHDVFRPVPAYSYEDGKVTGASFKANVEAEQPADTLEFQAFAAWTLTDGQFVHPEASSGGEGTFKIPVRLDPNLGTAERTDQITLSGNGVNTVIQFIQAMKKQETPEE